MSKMEIEKIIESVLAREAKGQINLSSQAARKSVAKKILSALSKKYIIENMESRELYE